MVSVYNSAISAYNNASKMLAGKQRAPIDADAPKTFVLPSGQAAPNPQQVNKPSFPELLEGSINNSMNTQYKGEQVSAKSLVRKAELHEMVTAVTNAELTLQTVVAVRDKVINAYQDILKMPI